MKGAAPAQGQQQKLFFKAVSLSLASGIMMAYEGICLEFWIPQKIAILFSETG